MTRGNLLLYFHHSASKCPLVFPCPRSPPVPRAPLSPVSPLSPLSLISLLHPLKSIFSPEPFFVYILIFRPRRKGTVIGVVFQNNSETRDNTVSIKKRDIYMLSKHLEKRSSGRRSNQASIYHKLNQALC